MTLGGIGLRFRNADCFEHASEREDASRYRGDETSALTYP